MDRIEVDDAELLPKFHHRLCCRHLSTGAWEEKQSAWHEFKLKKYWAPMEI